MIKVQAISLGMYCHYTEDNDIAQIIKDCDVVLQKGGRGIMSINKDIYYKNNYDIRKLMSNIDRSTASNISVGIKINHEEVVEAIKNRDVIYDISDYGENTYIIDKTKNTAYKYDIKRRHLHIRRNNFMMDILENSCNIHFVINTILTTEKHWKTSYEEASITGIKDCLSFFDKIEIEVQK